jgi:hypothetical protein
VTNQPPYGPDYGQQQPPSYDQPTAAQPYGQPPTGQPPAPGGYPTYPAGPGPATPTDGRKGFLGALFDFSFTSFVTPTIVKFVYILITIGLALGYLLFVIVGFAGDTPAVGIVVLLLGWIPFLVYLALARMTLEFYFALVRMSEDIHHRLPAR